tara:strand:- start:146 stop:955 length:810 start_codon:yes stop_codon:yes gene_type:complete
MSSFRSAHEQQIQHEQHIHRLENSSWDKDKFKAYAVELCVKATKCWKVEKAQLSSKKAKKEWLEKMVSMWETEEGVGWCRHIVKKRCERGDYNFVSKPVWVEDCYGKPKLEQIVINFAEETLELPLDERTRKIIWMIKKQLPFEINGFEQGERMTASFKAKADFWRGAIHLDLEMMNDAHNRINVGQSTNLDEMMEHCRDGVQWELVDDGREEKYKYFETGKETDTKEKRDERTVEGQEETMMDFSRRIRKGFLEREAVMKCVENTLAE